MNPKSVVEIIREAVRRSMTDVFVCQREQTHYWKPEFWPDGSSFQVTAKPWHWSPLATPATCCHHRPKTKNNSIEVTYSPKHDIAYMSLREVSTQEIARTKNLAARQRIVVDSDGVVEMIIDFDMKDQMLGLEVLNAASRLPPQMLTNATIL